MYILVLNLGLKSIRAIVFNQDGIKVVTSSLPISTSLKGNFVEQDPDEWWEKGKQVISDAVQDDEIRNHIKYITVTSSSACLVPIDKTGNYLYKAIMVSDKRALKQSSILESLDEFIAIRKILGLSAKPYFMIPKIMWLKDNVQQVFTESYKFLSPNDYLINKLTGKCVTDSLNAEKYYYNVYETIYPEKLLRRLSIPLDTLPEVVSPGTNIGTLKPGIIKELRLPQDVNLIVSTYDAICAFIGSGPSCEGEACDVSGTVTSFRVLTRNKVNDDLERIFTQFLKPGMYIVGGSNNLGGGLIEWLKQCFYVKDEYPYEIMEKEARESPLGADGLIFLPYLLGERAPLWNPHARGVFFGLERNHTRCDIAKSVFESAGFSVRNLQDVIESNGINVKNIRVSGGLTRLKYISELKADITGKEVLVVDEFESTSLGAFIIVGIAAGIFRDFEDASSKVVNIREVIIPNKKNHEKYNKIYQLYSKLYSSLTDLFLERQKLLKDISIDTVEQIANL